MAPIYTTRLDNSRKDIRLLELLPANSLQDPIQCRLNTTQLSIETEYIALSYVWGDPTATSPITVNGLPFQATYNLCAALRRIRSKSNLPTTLWVDAICINQSDNDEKSAQVPLMRDIYHNASLVTIWLGESDKFTDEAMVLARLTAYLLKCPGAKGKRRYPADYILSVVTSAVFKSDLRLLALRKFFSRPWWSRVWVVREVIVSRRAHIICGTKEIPWNDIRLALRCWMALLSWPGGSKVVKERKEEFEYMVYTTKVGLFMNLSYQRDQVDDHVVENRIGSFPGLHNRNDEITGLEGTILAGHQFESTDPRDKIYAWLGIYERDGLTIVPDYNASTAQVYVSAVKAITELTGSLSLVALTGGLDHSQDPLPGLPSWAPDFRHGNQRKSSWGALMCYNASASEMARAAFSPDGKVLRADTLLVDHIQLIDADQGENGGWKEGLKLCR
ncbi:heterokaryon incompatibility protein-domain-containing protein [Neurospora tetraspora]|uniref:Heterokaryon incompatibility protein-domain-containing protein n=1 Tax=Neurospora tetraspora TaxID=94610 RepID=A0AAE0JM36_9PEZI|nr:heterokaryon incompatibility protein-domain-containing protein [Neurospora tetraspora]